MSDELLSRADGPAWRITIGRPERRNALTPELARRIAGELDRAAAAGTARAILLEGVGGHFCAGLDLRWLGSLDRMLSIDELRSGLRDFQSLPVAIVQSPLPVVALVRGTVAGFGVDLAAVCDIRIAGTSASFTSAFARMGLVPDGGSTWSLGQLIGHGAALRFLLSGETLDAAAALRLGLVGEVVDDATLNARAAELVAALAANAAGSLAAIKRLVRAGFLRGLERALLDEEAAQLVALQGEEFQQRLRAFLARSTERTP
jgi:2-(1,2-epoxy-1,2-dihydrophenyl)acetyl-CoA isomerase